MSLTKSKPFVIVITGLSGSGKSSAIKALEDSGVYCIDNLPSTMINAAIKFVRSSDYKAYAFGMDLRDAEFLKKAPELRKKLERFVDIDVVFVTASEEAIVERYRSSRRKHPLLDTGGELLAAVRLEKNLLMPISEIADVVFDTSNWSPNNLSRAIESRYSQRFPSRSLFLTIMSFGFKHGQYTSADNIFDVRFLDNPHFVPALKEKTGLNATVREFIMKDPKTQGFLERLIEFFEFVLPLYYAEGKHYLRVGIGCTGGKHRSVCIAEEMGRILTEKNLDKILISVLHRDLQEFK